MRKVSSIILLLLLVINLINSQSKKDQLDTYYLQIDSVSYLKSLEDVVIESVIRDFNKPLEAHIKEKYCSIKNGIGNNIVKFVLNVDIDTAKLDSGIYDYLKIDTSRNNFNVYCFDKSCKPVYFIFFHEGKLEFYGDFFPTFSKRYSKKVRSALRTVFKKKPSYLLNCIFLPNTILYVKDDKIFVHRVLQNEIYQLNDYVVKFKDSKYFYVRQ